MGFRKKFASAGIAVALAALALAAAASADPTGEFAPFIQCPYKNPEVEHCVRWDIDTASMTLGERNIPWVNPGALLQGGYSGEGPETYVDPFVDSIFGLPSEENSAVWEGVFEDASAEAVDASDP